MHESVFLQLHADIVEQTKIEQKLAISINECWQRNMQAIKQFLPTLVTLGNSSPSRYEIIATANSTLNIADKVAGVALYGLEPQTESQQEVSAFLEVHRTTLTQSGKRALIIIGIGLGYHLQPLLEAVQPDYLLLYEQESDLLLASFKSAPWFACLHYCQINNTQVFVQFGDAAKQLSADIAELKSAFPDISTLLFYEHLCYAKQQALTPAHLAVMPSAPEPLQFLPRSLVKLSSKQTNAELSANNHACFKNNMAWLKQVMPKIYQLLRNYTYQEWQLCRYQQHFGMQDQSGHFFSSSLNKQNKKTQKINTLLLDPIIFDQFLPKKQKNTTFYHFNIDINQLRDRLLLINKNDLTNKFDEQIILGTADYEACYAAIKHSKKVIVLELSLDFLYGSLFLMPWFEAKGTVIFNTSQKELETCIAHLFKQDQLLLSASYVHNGYYEKHLRQAFKSIQHLIQTTNGKSNHFEKKLSEITNLYLNANSAFYYTNKQLISQRHLLIVGNGPSLTELLPLITTNRHHFTVISCGTALRTLFNNAIQPDYHVELEKGPDTLNQLQQMPADFLLGLTLLSTADQDPLVVNCFKQALLVLMSSGAISDAFSHQLTLPLTQHLTHSYHTVTNFAVDFFLSIGCEKLFLAGVDFGFWDKQTHHAPSSGYFKADGSPLYDFELVHGAAYPVEANFGGTCLTNHTFDSARALMADRLSNTLANQQVYNLSNGAKINGTINLKMEQYQAEISRETEFNTQFQSLFKQNITRNAPFILSDELKQAMVLLRTLQQAPLTNATAQERLVIYNNLLKSVDINTAPHLTELLNGSLRYLEMITNRLLMCQVTSEAMSSLFSLWDNYLQNSMIKLEQLIATLD